ncbi:MAG: cytochrome c oxidase subunit II [Fidelibacterota bacterium]
MENSGTFFLPEQGSTVAPQVDTLFYFILIGSAIIFAIVLAGLLYFGIKYRARKSDTGLTPGITHNTTLEMIWTIIPTILVIIVFIWGFKTYLTLSVVPRNAIEVKVTGKKWLWVFDYPDGRNSVNELIVPVNQPVKLVMSSEDVIHSFYVPNFRVKMDVVPNRYSVTWFEAVKPGKFQLFCTEFCGTGHSEMIGTVTVLSKDEYAAWLAKGADSGEGMSLEELGQKVFQDKACFTCHTLDGNRLVGPSLKGIFGHSVTLTDGREVTVDENYLRRSLLEPQTEVVDTYAPVMPTYQGLLSERELDAIISFIKTLK